MISASAGVVPKDPGASSCPGGALMCAHANGSPEDCALAGDPVTGNLICVAHPQQPIPRQRDDDADLLVAEMQRALAE